MNVEKGFVIEGRNKSQNTMRWIVTTQYKYEVLITAVEGKPIAQTELLWEVKEALRQELGFHVALIQVNQTGFLINDEAMQDL